jgi:parallel beta-helix repeat protein
MRTRVLSAMLCVAMCATVFAVTAPTNVSAEGASGVDERGNTLIGYRWNGVQEEVISIDPTTNSTSVIATPDLDLVTDSGFAVDSDNSKAYLYGGKNGESFWRIYTTNLISGEVSSVPFLEVGVGGFGFDSYKEDTLIGYRWNGVQEEVVSIDPTTNSTSIIATLDLDWVTSGGFAVDSDNSKAYLYGGKVEESFWRIYTTNLTTGEVSSVPFPEVGVGVSGFDSYEEDTLIGYKWDGVQEEIISIDPTTNLTSTIAALDLEVVTSGGFAVDSDNSKAYLYGGKDGGSSWRIYTTNLMTGEVSSVPFSESGAGGFGFDSYVTTLALTSHNPILIDGNAGFTNESGVVWGSGTESNPYIIESWDISASTANGIEIRNTDANFTIRDCNIHGGFLSSHQGIYLVNCTNAILTGNNCSNNWDGIYLWSSSDNNTLTNNTCNSNNWYGILLWMSSNNTLTDNNCSNNYYGMELSSSGSNIMSSNKVFDNTQYGVDINSGSNNRIWNNTFINNNGAGSTYDSSHIQAYDNGANNWWNTSGTPHGYGNYWSDWTTPDVNGDGIVDWSYNLTGSAGAKDYYPLTTTPSEPIPEFAMMPFVVMVLLAAIALTIGTMRRKT